MNTTSSTSITSTIGVTLMSAIGLRRLPRLPPPLRISIAIRSGRPSLVEAARQPDRDFLREVGHALGEGRNRRRRTCCRRSAPGWRRTRPRAVANSASAMPGATTVRLVSPRAAMSRNEFMIPMTVPSRPMKGVEEAMIASVDSPVSIRSVSRLTATSICAGARSTIALASSAAAAAAVAPFTGAG